MSCLIAKENNVLFNAHGQNKFGPTNISFLEYFHHENHDIEVDIERELVR